jgi:parallel beta-helix repeat protein
MRPLYFFWLALLPLCGMTQPVPEISLQAGQRITSSCRVKAGYYDIAAPAAADFAVPMDLGALQPVLWIEGDGTTVDFQQAMLRGSVARTLPDALRGVAIAVRGKNVTIKNARAKGYKVALIAVDAEGLRLENCDFSYNYRPKLGSTIDKEDEADWLSYHQNEQDEWLRYGAGIYLKNCDKATVKGCRITNCQNALLLTGCEDGTYYNNTFQFNSGLGIGMYRSSRNKLMHNYLDWNVRGYSHGVYARGQDAAAILVYEQSSENLFAYNSATHGGDGFFLWAGQQTMDSGQGGSNDNFIFGNDFSHAATNGVEATFSRNSIRGNLIRECTHGIWAGYSYETVIMGNLLSDCKTGIAIEHGQNNVIQQNLFQYDSTGINLWAREAQPADWGFAQKRDVRNRDNKIDRNVFLGVRKPLKISNSLNTAVNGMNLFWDFERVLGTAKPNENLTFLRNDIYGTTAEVEEVWSDAWMATQRKLNFSHEEEPQNPFAPLDVPIIELKEPDSLADGIVAVLPESVPRGRQFIWMTEWGPYDFRRPHCQRMSAKQGVVSTTYTYMMMSPPGKWRVTDSEGVATMDKLSGDQPAEITIVRAGKEPMRVEFEFVCDGNFYDEWGEKVSKGKQYRFSIRE